MRPLRSQQGATLFAMLAVVALAGSGYLVSRLQSLGGNIEASHRAHNGVVLKQAKAALLAYVAHKAAMSAEDYPGRFPCPEPGSHVGDSSNEGYAGPSIGASTCSNVGRLPWKTIGADRLLDAAGEPLWYVVTVGSSGWALQTSSTALVINSNKDGGLSVDGQANAAVAVIIAPGAAMSVSPTAAQSTAGCAARTQNRSATPPNYLDYLECHNIGSNAVVTAVTGNVPNAASDGTSNTVFNDQVITITAAEVMAVVEPVIAKRIESQIAPVLKAMYADSTWGRTTANPLFPYAAPFGDPSTSNYRGTAGTYQGLLPFFYSGSSCGTDPRCVTTSSASNTSFNSGIAATATKISGPGAVTSIACSFNATPRPRCTGRYDNNSGGNVMTIRMTAVVNNAAMALRTIDQSKLTVEYRTSSSLPYTVVACATCLRASFNADGSATIYAEAPLPYTVSSNWYFRMTIASTPLTDHAVLSASDATTGWFVKNEWYKLVYYAAAQNITAAGLPTPACTTGTNCLTVTNTTPANNKRALLILAGRSMSNAARPNALLGDFVEFGNADGNTTFEQQTVARPLGTVFADTGLADAYVIAKDMSANGPAVYFKAANSNTGAATLRAGSAAARPIVNADGSALSASQIIANGVVQITFDGTNYMISKRPFNDRVVVIDAN
jgi:hypothetical protein